MKRVVHIFNSSIVSGPETLVLPALSKLRAPASVIFLSEARREQEARRPVAYARSLGLDTHEVKVRSRVDLQAIRELAELLTKLDPAIAHSHDVKASTYLLKASRKVAQRGFRIFSTHHGVRGRSGWKPRLYERFYSGWILPSFDRILTVCTSDREALLRRGLDPARVKVHLNGVDRRCIPAATRTTEAAEIRRRWGLEALGVDSGDRIVGLVGRLAGEKRIDRLLEIARIMNERDPGCAWTVLVFGTGELEKPLKEQSSALGLQKRVRWMGYRSGLGDELAGLDILVSVSDAEGLPINLIEAGWAGTPVFATAVDGNLDLILSSDQGILISPAEPDSRLAEALLEMIRDPARCRGMGERFQARVRERFSGDIWVKELEKLYSE